MACNFQKKLKLVLVIILFGMISFDLIFAQQVNRNNSSISFGTNPDPQVRLNNEVRAGTSAVAQPLVRSESEAALSQRPEPSAKPDSEQNNANTAANPTVNSTAKIVETPQSGGGYDPIAANGQYFEGWEKPELALIFTGGLDGYVEPCGCAGIAQMKGGLSRRSSFFKELQAKEWPYIAIDNGGFVKGFGRQEELKFFSMIVPGMVDQMKYDAIGIGPNDLRLPADSLLACTTNSPDIPSVFTSANVGVYGFDPMLTAPYRVIDKHGIRIGVTSIIGKSWQTNISNSDILLDDPIKRLRLVVPKLEKEGCKWLVLISHASMEETLAIAKAFPQFGIIVCADTPSEPPLVPKLTSDSNPAQYLIEAGEKGKFAIVLGFFGSDAEVPVRYQRVAFDSRYKNDRLIVEQMQLYQENIKAELETKGFHGFGMRPVPPPNSKLLGGYVGSKKCESCHDESYRTWRRSDHAKAWESLAETSVPSRIYDPECVCCHVVGWNPEEKYPYVGGFSNEKGNMTLDMINVGCENCHGPGEKHCLAEAGSNEAEQEQYRAAMRLTTDEVGQRMCYTCHDLDNSPEFNFETYWPKIEHKELLDLDE